MLSAGLGAGLALRFQDEPRAMTAATPAATVAPAPTDEQRARVAIDRVLPAVVTVLASLPDRPQPSGQILESQNFGSGIVVSDQGWVITNYHVVAGAEEIAVVLSTGEERPATLVADDSPFHDLAVLRVSPGGLRAAALGDSDALRLGERVFAVASGLVTYDLQVKSGVISTIHLPFPRSGVILEDMVQTDAPVNHGDSGGALINVDGEVIGLLTTVVRQTPNGLTVEGVALAHSSNSLRPIVDAVVATGRNPRLRYGFERLETHHVPVTRAIAEEEGLPVSSGALIIQVVPGSPAEEAGVQPGDVIVSVNGTAVESGVPLVNLLGALPPDASPRFGVVRGEDQREIQITPRPVVTEASNG